MADGLIGQVLRTRNSAGIYKELEETVERLIAAAVYGNEETPAHLTRLALYSQVLAEAAGWSGEQLDYLGMAASLHDIGKIGVPDAILWKPDQLTPDERVTMQMHTVFGASMLAASDCPALLMAQQIALHHHERWNGGGYPEGRAGTAIPPAARIVAILDCYDALMHDRVYRPAMSEAEVLELLRKGRETLFDPELLEIFFRVLPELRRIALQHPDVPKAESGIQRVLTRPSDSEHPLGA